MLRAIALKEEYEEMHRRGEMKEEDEKANTRL
jgi:hypothetical protein